MSCSSWDDSGFDVRGHHRQVNYVLGNLCRLHYPGLVTGEQGELIVVLNWDQYRLAPNADHLNAQGAVWSDFWVRFSRAFVRCAFFTSTFVY